MNYKVKAGDTLGQIAKLNGVTLSQLLESNPDLKANPNRINVGMVLNIPDEFMTAATRPLPTTPPTPPPASPPVSQPATSGGGAVGAALAVELGVLSAKYETGGRGPGIVSTGSGDPGGVSYGSYQMATKTGTVARFVSQSDFRWRDEFQGLTPGTASFTAKWKEIAAAEPVAFQEVQHEFIKRTHYDILVAKTLNEDGLDVNTRSKALQNAVWSTAVQHGGANSIVHNALAKIDRNQNSPDFDEQLIRAIYAERGRKRADGNLAWFSKSSPAVQTGVANRFKNEMTDALNMLAKET